MAAMTGEEADALDELLTRTTPKSGREKAACLPDSVSPEKRREFTAIRNAHCAAS
jgi:hypothetical protein